MSGHLSIYLEFFPLFLKAGDEGREERNCGMENAVEEKKSPR